MPAFFLFLASFEGLLNLIYELYLNNAFRNDDRIREQLKRSHIDIKLRLAPAYCNCFKGKVITADDLFKRFKAVSELRNDFIHANLTSGMLSNVIKEEGITFRYPPETKVSKGKKSRYPLPANPDDFELVHLEFVCETIEKTVELVLSSMKERYKREFSNILHKDSFIASFVDGEYVIDSEDQ